MSDRRVHVGLPFQCSRCETTWANVRARSAHERQVHPSPDIRAAQARANEARRRVANRLRMARVRLTPEGHAAQSKSESESFHRRRLRKAGIVLTIRIESDDCGVCGRPLVPTTVWPDPMSTSVGHEPPLSRAMADGWTTVVERPEHYGCNSRKWNRYDYEMAS